MIDAGGRETRGKGTAKARIESRLEPTADDGTRVVMETDLAITGAVAQYGRGMIADVSKRLTGEFAKCLGERIAAAPSTTAAAPADQADDATAGSGAAAAEPAPAAAAGAVAEPAPVAKPIGGLRLGLWALWRAIARLGSRIGHALTAPFRGR